MRKTLLIYVVFLCMAEVSTASPKTLTLKSDQIEAEFDAKNGALIKLINLETGWEIMSRQVLGRSFELLMPLNGEEMTMEDIRFNVIKGIEQTPPVIEQLPDGIVFTWSGMRSDKMKETADITFRGIVSLTEIGLEYSGELINNSPHPVEYISWPCLGEVSVPDKGQPLYHSTLNATRQLFPRFYNQHGYWGVDYPTSTYELPQHALLLVNNDEQGFIFYNREKLPSNLILISFELIPGFEIKNMNPYGNEMDGELVRIQFKANQVLYNNPGEKSVLNPLILSVYKGDSTVGLNLFHNNLQTKKLRTPLWIGEPLTWQKIAVSSGNDLIRQARDASEMGVNVLQVRGWSHDSNGSIIEVDGLAKAIDQCHEIGMRIVLETNWTEVNTRSQAYGDHLHKYVIKDPFMIPYNKSLLCPLAEKVQERAMREWLKLSALRKADGYINTDNNHRNNTYLCFDASHDHRPGEPTANGTMALNRIMCDSIRGNNSETVAMGFGFLDEQNTFYDGYQITASKESFWKHRYIRSLTPIIATVDVRDARQDINMSLMYRFNIAYDLQFHNNRLKDYPHISTYGRQVEALRRQYAEYIWDGIFMGQNCVRVDGKDVSYSVFANKNGKRAVIAVNTGTEQATKITVKFDQTISSFFATPENPNLQPYSDGMELDPQSAIIVFEQ